MKGPRYITHMLRLQNIGKPLANFFASGVLRLREKLGPILWQLPASSPFDAARLSNFLALLPQDLEAAAKLARGRDAFMRGRSVLSIGDANRRLQHALEVRDASFADPRCLRLHGDKELYRSGYSARALARWAARIAAWSASTRRLRAPGDARNLMARLGLQWQPRAAAPDS